MSKAEEKPYLQDLFEHMSNEHGLTLLQTEMQEIIDICLKQTDYNSLSSENAQLKEALREIIKESDEYIIPDADRINNSCEQYIEIDDFKLFIKKAKQLLNKE